MTIRLHHPTTRNLNPVAHQEQRVRILRQELLGDYPYASPEQLEIAIGNALKRKSPAPDPARLEELTRHQLGYLP